MARPLVIGLVVLAGLLAAVVFTPNSTSRADPSFQPAAPVAAAFFYPWFPSAWTQGGVYPYTHYTPAAGFYSSTDDAVIDQQLAQADRAHLEALISSWWGRTHHTNAAFQHILDRSERVDSPTPNMRWAVYYEPEGYGSPTSLQIMSDLSYLSTNYFGHPGYLRVNGKPVVFVYGVGETCETAARWVDAQTRLGGTMFIVLKVFTGYASCPSQPDSWHQYAPANSYGEQAPHSSTVSPGFWLAAEATPRLERDAARFEADVQRMAGTNYLWHLITTWNEWGEGTGIEPTVEFGDAYIEILCHNLPGATPCLTTTPTPSPTATPSADPVLIGAGDIASCTSSGDESTANLLDGIAGTVIAVGDLAYDDGTATEFADCYEPSWGRHKSRTKPVPGNHEVNTSGASGYYGYFGDIASPDEPGCVTGCRGYYAYDRGNWRVYALNSNTGLTAELSWLQADLAANPRQCSLAYYHHPVLTAGPHANDVDMIPIWQALWDAGADLVVSGHDHSYQRYARLDRDANGVDAGGMRQIIVGTGGKGMTATTRADTTPGLEVLEDGTGVDNFGVIKLTLHADSYDWQFVPIAGTTFTDSGNEACRMSGPDADGDYIPNTSELSCGSNAFTAASRPERLDGPFTGIDDDGEALVDEPLPGSATDFDCDGDGYKGSAEDHVFGGAGGRDQDACGNDGWPADLSGGGSLNKITLTDLTSFLAPVPKKLNTNPGDAGYDVRWDLVPGAPAGKQINLVDMTSTLTVRPAMLGGVKAFSGPVCPWPP